MSQIESLVRARYCGSQGWLTLDEVADGPGYGAGRRLDLVAVGCWNSNAGHLVGFEVKRSVADWRRELEQPGKREVFVDEVHEFVFVAPWDVIDPKEVPEGCGLLSVNSGGELRMRVRAKQMRRTPSPAFTTALFRAALRQIGEHERQTRDFTEFRGRSLSFADLQRLAGKARARFAESTAEEAVALQQARETRRQQTRGWGDLLSQLVLFGAEMVGETRWRASTDKIPTYADAIRLGMARVRSGGGMPALDVAKRLRSLANELAPEAAGATA